MLSKFQQAKVPVFQIAAKTALENIALYCLDGQ